MKKKMKTKKKIDKNKYLFMVFNSTELYLFEFGIANKRTGP